MNKMFVKKKNLTFLLGIEGIPITLVLSTQEDQEVKINRT